MSLQCYIHKIPVEVISDILLHYTTPDTAALVCKLWFLIVRPVLFRRLRFLVSLRTGGISFLRNIKQPTIPSIRASRLDTVLCNIRIDMPPTHPGSRWRTLWEMLHAALPQLVSLRDITFYFRHAQNPMVLITPLVPKLSAMVKTMRLVPVKGERYYDVRTYLAICTQN